MEPLQISVVGAGYWGKKVIREILNLAKTTGKVKLCSVVDSSPIDCSSRVFRCSL